jgi:caa(3)-type oxidase subunit IV
MHPIPSVRTYVIVSAIIEFVTYYVAQIDLGASDIVVALLIAFIKMSLVVLIFTNLKADSPLTKLFAVAGFWGWPYCWDSSTSTTFRAAGCPRASRGSQRARKDVKVSIPREFLTKQGPRAL